MMVPRRVKRVAFADCRCCRHGEHENNCMCFCRVLKMFRACGRRRCDYFSFAEQEDAGNGRES